MPTIGSYPRSRLAFSILCQRDAHVNVTLNLVNVGSLPDNHPHHSAAPANTIPMLFENVVRPFSWRVNPSARSKRYHTARRKSQKYTGSPLVMKNACPATERCESSCVRLFSEN